MKIFLGLVAFLALAFVSAMLYVFSPPPPWWVDYRLDSLGAGRIETTKTSGSRFIIDEGYVFFRDAADHRAQCAFQWQFGEPIGGETPDILRSQLRNARADVARSEWILEAFHAHGFRNVQLRFTSEQDIYLEHPGLLMFDEDPNINSKKVRLANTRLGRCYRTILYITSCFCTRAGTFRILSCWICKTKTRS